MSTRLELVDGSRVAVLGGGPAGAFFAYFLLTYADQLDLRLEVDIYEPRDFTIPGPGGCNMCGGIVSETLIQSLAVEGINLPSDILQRGIDSYVLHTDRDDVRIETPANERRIASLHRGGGPRDIDALNWGGLDGYLLSLAQEKGAQVIHWRIGEARLNGDRPSLSVQATEQVYDLLVGATGINSGAWDVYEALGVPGGRPASTKAYITELKLGSKLITEHLGDSMHIFFLDVPRIESAAIIPKGDYATVCLLGDEIDRSVVDSFFEHDAVRRSFPDDRLPEEWALGPGACHCSPRINIREASVPFADRVVLVGDSGATRLYKDGIGSAYRTAKAAARTAIFSGVAAADFERHYLPVYQNISSDNRYGRLIFRAAHRIKALRPLVDGVARMANGEQSAAASTRRMSLVLWDMFTGSAPYREIFWRTVDPRFVASFGWSSLAALASSALGRRRATPWSEQYSGDRTGTRK
jgi:flavin-dependent dehydrogenase